MPVAWTGTCQGPVKVSSADLLIQVETGYIDSAAAVADRGVLFVRNPVPLRMSRERGKVLAQATPVFSDPGKSCSKCRGSS